MQGLYPWIVFLHVVAAFTFVLAHGASAFASYQIRQERDGARIGAMLDLSRASLGVAYGALAVLLLAGIAAGIIGGHFGRLWIWLSLGILVAVMVAMYALAVRYYARVRTAVGLETYFDRKGAARPVPASPEELERILRSHMPDLIGIVGFLGLAAIIWLMLFKPF